MEDCIIEPTGYVSAGLSTRPYSGELAATTRGCGHVNPVIVHRDPDDDSTTRPRRPARRTQNRRRGQSRRAEMAGGARNPATNATRTGADRQGYPAGRPV